MSNLSLHWVNDLPGTLKSCREALRPDGVFLAAVLGGATLQELRSAFAVADNERIGGVSPHVSPFVNGGSLGELLHEAGFTLPTVDTESITVLYPDMFTLMDHLQGMGDTNCAITRPNHVPRDVSMAAAAIYDSLYRDENDMIPATFQVYYLVAWGPSETQPQPKKRGSGSYILNKQTRQHFLNIHICFIFSLRIPIES
jgi:NADH dehydrogenase [ubiquinone] 1 alpha subcomplex assembly factor 5